MRSRAKNNCGSWNLSMLTIIGDMLTEQNLSTSSYSFSALVISRRPRTYQLTIRAMAKLNSIVM